MNKFFVKLISFFESDKEKRRKLRHLLLHGLDVKEDNNRERQDSFVYIDEKPIYEKNYTVLQSSFKTHHKLAIVMQGPLLYENDFTLETLKIYKKTFPKCSIIVSTWDTEKKKMLEQIEKLGCIVLKNSKPDFVTKENNNNYQIKSTKKGLQKAKEIGAKYVIKTRCDQRMYETHIVEYLFNLLKVFPLKEHKLQKERLVTLSLNTFKYRLYDISDMFLFGHIDDVMNFWDVEYDHREKLPSYMTLKDYSKARPSEIGYTIDYLERIGEKLDYTLKNSWEMYAKYFCVIDTNTVGLIWPKYSNKIFRWRNFYGEQDLLEELTFKEWLNLYTDVENIIPNEDILERKYY